MIIGITGSIGSGKSTVAKLFSKHHFNRIDADEVGHKLLKNSQIKNKIINEFGINILNKNRGIDRKKLSDIVFNNEKQLKKLNSIMHPIIVNEIKNQIKRIQQKYGNKTKIVIDSPLLLETNAKKLVDKIIIVKTSKENILKRNKNFSKKKIETILKHQTLLKDKLKHANFVIDNSKDLKHLEKQVKNIIKKLNQ